ncbi:hypothetical protein [Escherichia coli]|uniref:hypothetical protein n=1 Tax=Escherichia coli TaxID=562 RepID=UPI000DE44C74|nr:hypothetical protein [Escherichia coli]MBG3880796.1 hypothetical protein [Escherichia coli]RCB79236.1 hypothetical protein C6B35_19605 [Escherichia coli]RCB87263.1 hypothetical protein C6A94_15820 [Escherichia coli]
MTVMTLNLVEKQPAAMRRIIGKHLAVPRWQDTCDYYNQMMERERLTVCFHAQLFRINHEIMHQLGLAVVYEPETGMSGGAVVAADGIWNYSDEQVERAQQNGWLG